MNNQSKISRDKLIKKFLLNGIEAKRVFFSADEMHVYKKYITRKEIFPNSKQVSANGLCLPSFVSLKKPSLDRIISIIERETLQKV